MQLASDLPELKHSLAAYAVTPAVADPMWARLIAGGAGGRKVPRPATVEVRALGELDVLVNGERAGDGLRRSRVRTMLELIVLNGTIRRERLADLMWPELAPGVANANLRVTLTRLRTLLGCAGGDGRAVLEADSNRVSLKASAVRIDLWDFDRGVADADAAQRSGDRATAVALLERACRLWRGEPLADLERVDGVAGEVEEARRRVTSAALRLATLLFESGRFDESAYWARRVRESVPYDERAHRLVIASHLACGDRPSAVAAARATQSMLDELAVTPEPATAVLLAEVCTRV